MADISPEDDRNFFPPLSQAWTEGYEVAVVANRAMEGKINATGVFLSPAAGTHTVYDSRISIHSVVLLVVYGAAPTQSYVVSVADGEMVVEVVEAAADTEFRYVVIG